MNGQRTTLTEAGRPCTFDLESASAQFGGSAGSGRIAVATLAGCSWKASTTATWIQVAATTISGSGSVDFQVAANAGAERTGVIVVADKQFVVSQAAGAPTPVPAANCAPTVTPLTIDTAAAASTQSIQLVIGPDCPWSASSNATWLTITSAANGSGTAVVMIAVGANTGVARTGTLTVAGQLITVRQAALSCTFSLNPTSQNLATAGGNSRFTVTTQNGCAWTASTTASWVTLTASAGTGTGDVTFSAQANSTPAVRSATISVSGQTFTVTEAAAPCAYTLAPASMNVPADGGRNRFTINTSASCAWTAVSGAAWIDVVNSSGTSSGDVNFNVQANPSTTERSATITAGGQTFTVNQAGIACTYTLNPGSTNVPAAGGNGHFTVTTQAGCSWTAQSGGAWVTIGAPPNGMGTGTADVTYTVQPNTDAAARTTTIGVGGQTFTINQAAAAPQCTYTLNPSSTNAAAAGVNGQFTVTTQAGCNWTAVAGAAWVTVSAPPNGTGTGTGDVSYTVAANADPAARSTTITVGGQTYTVNQAAAAPQCVYSLNPTSGSFSAAAGSGTFTVTTQAGCAWTASTQDAWVSVTKNAGTGTADVTYTVQANATGAARSGTITAGGQQYSVTQAP